MHPSFTCTASDDRDRFLFEQPQQFSHVNSIASINFGFESSFSFFRKTQNGIITQYFGLKNSFTTQLRAY